MRRFVLTILAACFASAAVAVELGDDGLHKTDWQRDTFKDLREDLEEANGEGKRLVIMFEQRGCVYCTKMHQEVFPDPEVTKMMNSLFKNGVQLAKLLNPELNGKGQSVTVSVGGGHTAGVFSPQQLTGKIIAELEAQGIDISELGL